MKRLFTLLLAAALTLGAMGTSHAIEFKGKGYWSYSLEMGLNNKFVNKDTKKINDDEFSAGARLRLQLDAVASESLSGTVYFEIGDVYFGNASTGGALGGDGKIVELKRAFLDWTVPNTDLKLRMGMQGMKLPLMASEGNFVLDDDAAGIVASYKINDNVGITAMWARLLNDNTLTEGKRVYVEGNPLSGQDHDALDFFALMVPLKFDGIRVTPWVGFSAMGDGVGSNPDSDYTDAFVSTSRKKFQEGMGVYTGTGKGPIIQEYGGGQTNTWWGGLSGSLTSFDPFSLKFDFMYGSKTGNGMFNDKFYLNDKGAQKKLGKEHEPLEASRYDRKGWFVSALAEYKLDWATPGIFFWYSSGDDDDLNNGSERMPALSGNWEYTHTGFKGTLASGAYDGLIGYSPIGLMGVALQLRDISFIEDLTNHIKVVYMRGTNSPNMPRAVAKSQEMLGLDIEGISPTGRVGSYLTTMDSAWEVNLDTEYKVYDNFKIIVEGAYIHMDFDQDTWDYRDAKGNKVGGMWKQALSNPDAFKIGVNFHYSF